MHFHKRTIKKKKETLRTLQDQINALLLSSERDKAANKLQHSFLRSRAAQAQQALRRQHVDQGTQASEAQEQISSAQAPPQLAQQQSQQQHAQVMVAPEPGDEGGDSSSESDFENRQPEDVYQGDIKMPVSKYKDKTDQELLNELTSRYDAHGIDLHQSLSNPSVANISNARDRYLHLLEKLDDVEAELPPVQQSGQVLEQIAQQIQKQKAPTTQISKVVMNKFIQEVNRAGLFLDKHEFETLLKHNGVNASQADIDEKYAKLREEFDAHKHVSSTNINDPMVQGRSHDDLKIIAQNILNKVNSSINIDRFNDKNLKYIIMKTMKEIPLDTQNIIRQEADQLPRSSPIAAIQNQIIEQGVSQPPSPIQQTQTQHVPSSPQAQQNLELIRFGIPLQQHPENYYDMNEMKLGQLIGERQNILKRPLDPQVAIQANPGMSMKEAMIETLNAVDNEIIDIAQRAQQPQPILQQIAQQVQNQPAPRQILQQITPQVEEALNQTFGQISAIEPPIAQVQTPAQQSPINKL